MRTSMPANMQHFQHENAKDEYYDEGEEEEDEDEYYNQYENSDNPFGVNVDHIIENEENKIDYNDHPIVQSQSKELQTVTLLVIEETLLEDFIIKDKAQQNRELSNIGEVKGAFGSNEQSKEETDASPQNDVKRNMQGEDSKLEFYANQPEDEKGKDPMLLSQFCQKVTS